MTRPQIAAEILYAAAQRAESARPMSVDVLDRVYDAYTGEMGQQFMRETQQRVHWMCGAATGERILDVGCSQGVVSILLGREGKEVLGIDCNAQAIKTAENHLASEAISVRKLVTFVDVDFVQHAFGSQRFDSVVLGEVLEHLLDPARFIDIAAQLLEPGGRIVVTVPFGINDHVDHKHTFYLRGPYRLLAKHFDVVEVNVLGKWLGLIGSKRQSAASEPETWNDALVSQLEAAFQANERQLIDELGAVRSRLDEANTKYRSSTEDVGRLKREVAHHEAERKQAERTRGQLESQLATRSVSEVDTQQGAIAQLLEERETRHAREVSLARLEERLNHADQLRRLEVEAREAEVARLNLLREQLAAELASGAMRLQRAELELDRVRQLKEQELAALAERHIESEQRATRLADEATKLEHELQQSVEARAADTDRWDDAQQQWSETRQHWDDDRAAWAQERAQWSNVAREQQARLDEKEAALAALTSELEATRVPTGQLELLTARLGALQTEHNRLEQELRRQRDRARQELSVVQRDAEQALERQRESLRDAQSKLAQSKRDLEEVHRAERRAKLELQTERRERSAAERRVEQTRNTLSFQLGYELIHGFKSRESLLALPKSLWHLNQEAARRRREKHAKHQVPIKPIAPAVSAAPVSVPLSAVTPFQATTRPVEEPTVVALSPPPARSAAGPTSLLALRVACIHDEFTFAAFDPECQLFQLSPTNWQAELAELKPDLLFVESAWRGKNEQWTRKVAHRSQELLGIVDWCRSNQVPTAFWNKEDPVHFRTFLNTAKLFDFVFTTDIDCIARYKRGLGHERVHLLPFAVQPKAHNPLEKYERKDAIAFAGAYYARYPERQADLENFVEHMASAPRLEIYDRNLGKTDPDYQFPERYQSHIVGTLKFDEIDRAYKGYRYALNLNSIKASQTMFARRVFELLACNTITVSNFSRGVRLLFGDLVIATDSGEVAMTKLRGLANDDARARRFRLLGLRKVLREHTYEARLRFIVDQVWGRPFSDSNPKICVVSVARTRDDALEALRQFDRQSWPEKRLLLVSDIGLHDLARPGVVECLTRSAAAQRSLRDLSQNATHLATFVVGDHYGASYLTDLALATTYSDAPAIGKSTRFTWASGVISLGSDGAQYRSVPRLAVRAALCRLDALPASPLSAWLDDAERANVDQLAALAIDEFNYCEGGGTAPPRLLAEVVDDLTDTDTGFQLSKLLDSAAAVRVPGGTAPEPQVGADKLARILKPARGKPLTVALEGEHLVVHSSLPDEAHEYIYASEAWRPADLGLPSPGRMHFSATPGLNVQLAMLFLDGAKKRIAHKLCQPGTNETIALPAGTEAVQLGLRVYGSGSAKLGGLLLDHVQETPHAIYGRSDYLLLTNRYPSRHDLYRNAFVHRRVAEYAKQGCAVDVFRVHAGGKLAYYEFDGVDVISGDTQALQTLLESTPYKAVLVHFLDAAMWRALAPFVGRARMLIWAHGAEIQAWHRRQAHYATRAALEAAQTNAEPRASFWRDVAGTLNDGSKLVFVSDHFAREVIGDLGLALPASRYEVIHNVIDTQLFAYRAKRPEQRKRILSIRPHTSRIYANDLAVATVLELQHKPYFNELEFHFIGDGPLFDETVAPLRALPNVRLEKRFLTQTQIAKLHQDYGIFLCPSRGDTQGVSRDEAMASGLVPITTRAGAIPEFVDQDAGFVVDLEDIRALAESVARLYEAPQLFLQLSEQAAARVRRQSSPQHTTARELSLIRGEG
jgi:spore maturation protein CgeB/glycosyltransferase involved in cell wall biosynthesis/ubiquinone/menaquinone biosynthesis C-methylase UbiE